MVVEKENFDIYKILRHKLFENLKRINHDKGHPFNFGSLILHTLFHIMHKFPNMHPHIWTNDKATMTLIIKHCNMQYRGDITSNLFGMFRGFQKR